jgi:hypothetical protein
MIAFMAEINIIKRGGWRAGPPLTSLTSTLTLWKTAQTAKPPGQPGFDRWRMVS